VLPVGSLVAVVGALLTLPDSLVWVVCGLSVVSVGFFAVHGVASGWVPARAHAGGVSTGQAASLYLVAYYLGSSVFGSLAGEAYAAAAWPGVVGLVTVLLAVAAACGQVLRRTPSLLEGPRDGPG
jgi:YNFM family putative membrane transporter